LIVNDKSNAEEDEDEDEEGKKEQRP